MILQLSECLSATNICEQNNISNERFYVYATKTFIPTKLVFKFKDL